MNINPNKVGGQQDRPPRKKPNNNGNGSQGGSNNNRPSASRGAAIRAQKRTAEDAHRIASQYLDAQSNGNGGQSGGDQRPRANFIDDSPRLKVIGLGGMDGGGSKN